MSYLLAHTSPAFLSSFFHCVFSYSVACIVQSVLIDCILFRKVRFEVLSVVCSDVPYPQLFFKPKYKVYLKPILI